MLKSIGLLCLINSVYATDDSAVFSKMKIDAEETIKYCETQYNTVKKLKDLFDNDLKKQKKPGLLAKKTDKELYKNKDIYIKALNIRFNEFNEIMNTYKIKIRSLQPQTNNNGSKDYTKVKRELQESAATYSSNCGRITKGLKGYVEWVLTGKAQNGYEKVYQDWLKDAQ